MLDLSHSIFRAHDLRFVALAIGVCALSCLTGAAIAQYSMKSEGAKRQGWFLLAGFVTGLGVWTTHFTAMLGYRIDLDIHFDLGVALYSLLLAVGITMVAGIVGLQRRERGLLAGVLAGVGVAVAHFIDMHAMRFSGIVVHDHPTSILAVFVGFLFSGAAGHFLVRWRSEVFAWPAAAAMFASVLSLHFIAMSGVTLVLADEPVSLTGWTASGDELAMAVVAAFLVMLGAAITYTWHSERLSRATADEQRRLIQTLQALRETEAHHRAYIELNPQIAWVADPNGSILEIAPLWGDLVGLPREASFGEGWASVVHPDDLPSVTRLWTAAIASQDGSRADVRYRVRLVDGSYRWFRARAKPRKNASGQVVAWYGSLEDVHEQVLAEEALRASEERYRLATRATSDVIWDWSFAEQRATWGGAHKKVLGFPDTEDQTNLDWWLDRIHPEDRSRVLASQAAALEGGADYWHEEYRFLTIWDNWIYVKTRCVIVRNEDGQPIRLVGSMLDITQQKTAEKELIWAAHHDPLTQLPNRTLFRLRKQDALDEARRSGKFFALIVVDLNNFKELNDTYGHALGDRVLAQIATRLLRVVPDEATVARLGGDEFAIILPELEAPDAYVEQMGTVLADMAEPVVVEDLRVSVNFSAGIAIWPRDAEDPAELLIAADLALYAAKDRMPGTIVEFTPSLKGAAEARSSMLGLARQALEEDRIVPYYQPKVDLQSGSIMGLEALIRIRGPNNEILAPSDIQAAFFDCEISVQLTDRMFARVFADLATWQAANIDPGRIAINVTAADFRQKALDERLKSHANAYGQSLSAVDIEVTETVLIGELGPEVSRMLGELRDKGVLVALDDFGTGYASLTHLQQFPVDVIKLDRSFIARIDARDPKATAVIDAVLQMAKRLDLQTVAEGIETVEQARYLRARGCNVGQGYLFDRPLPANEVPSRIQTPAYRQWQDVLLRR